LTEEIMADSTVVDYTNKIASTIEQKKATRFKKFILLYNLFTKLHWKFPVTSLITFEKSCNMVLCIEIGNYQLCTGHL